MDFTYREEPVAGDIEAVRRMAAGTGFFREDEVDVAAELVEERIAKGIDSGYYFCFAENDGTLAGYVCYGPVPCTIGSHDLYWIVVDAAWQGRGLGRELARRAETGAAALGGRRIYVETAGKDSYRSTRAFYEGIGYRQVASFPDFYDLGDAKIVYQKDI